MRLFLAMILAFTSSLVFSRVTNQSSTDIDSFCAGGLNKENCTDKNGNFLATVTGTQDLGTSGLKWRNLYLSGTQSVDILNVGTTFSVGTSLFYASGNRVGIKTTSPNSELDVSSTVTAGLGPEISLSNPGASGGERGRLSFYGNGNLRSYIDFRTSNVSGNGEIIFNAGAPIGAPGEIMRLDTNGYVGIGTTAPSTMLDVAGGVGLFPRTIAQLVAISTRAGVAFYCSNCSPPKIVVSTNTGPGNFSDAVGATFK